jgi:uncharacterized protein with GYD domain
MPTFMMQLRWNDYGYQNIKTAPARRALARTAAQNNNVTVVAIYDTLQGPDWIVAGTQADVNTLKGVFDNQPNPSVTTTIYAIGDEPGR